MNLSTLKKILLRLYHSYVVKYFDKLILSLLLSFGVAGSTASIAWLLDPAIKKMFIEQDRTMMFLIPIAIILAFSSKGLTLYFARTVLIKVGNSIVLTIQKQLASSILKSDIHTLESKHSGDLDKIREIYTLLRDYYNLYKKQNRSDKEISKLLWGKIKGIVYTKNIKFLKDAYKTITRLQYLRTHDRNIDKDTLNMILPMIESNKKYIERMN